MNSNLLKAIELIKKNEFTCVLCRDETVYTSMERGVSPLLHWISNDTNLQGFFAADKVVGKAAAFLYVILGVKAVYAPIMSESAVEVLEKHSIQAICDVRVEAIRNRSNTGFCPMESAVKDITEPQEAFEAILNRLNELNQMKLK